jgi:hypothetical protein
VRLRIRQAGWALVIGAVLLAPATRAQNPDTIAPEESAARAKRIMAQAVEARGGQAYLGMRLRQCDGRRALIGHNGELNGYVGFKDAWLYPDTNRTDYIAHARHTILGFIIGVQDLEITHGGHVITLYSGDHGWIMEKGGVSELPDTSVSDFQESVKQNVDNLLRGSTKQEGLNYRWGGLDTVDLKTVDWVEIQDPNDSDRTTKLAIDHSTHLLVRSVVVTQDRELNQSREDVTIVTNYQSKNGVQVPMQITRERDGRRISQVFYDECRLNMALPPDFFTRTGLEKAFKDSGGKAAKPEKADK